MPCPVTGSRAYFGGPPWWVVVALPVGLVLALFVLEGVGVPTAPAVMGSSVTVTGVQAPWADDAYLTGPLGMAAVMYALQLLLSRRRPGSAPCVRTGQ